MKLYSFDVFDTLITRCTATPKGIFSIMQKVLKEREFESISQFVKSNFYELRIGAEQVARNTFCQKGIEDVTLEQIYNVLVNENKITEEQAVLLQELERSTEMECVFGIRDNIEKVHRLAESGERVILISDMYMDRETIHKMLMKTDKIFAEIPLYVSSDKEKKNKWTGHLFKIVKEKEQVEYEDWKHVGDNERSDYIMPEKLGISCEKYIPEGLLDIEKEYLKSNEADVEVQLALGCARLARMSAFGNDAFRLGCGVGGNILFPYVKWLLEDCAARGIKRLYFIARDGFVLKELADCLIEQNNYNIKTKYVYGSRIAWRIPNEDNLKEEVLKIYKRSYQDRIFNAGDLAFFFQIPLEELLKYIPANFCASDKLWLVANVDFIIERLLQIPDFLSLLKEKYQEKKYVLLEYLKQEIDTSDEKFAFVDLAGSGFTQECLAKIMGCYYDGKINNYFFRRDVAVTEICNNYVFYPNYVSYIVLLEMMCRAPHGQTLGYQKDSSGKVVPVFSQTDGQAILEHHVLDFIEGIKVFGKIYNKVLGQLGMLTPNIKIISFYMNYIFYTPDKLVLDYFADMPNMLTGREKRVASYAPKLSARDIKNIYWYREKEPIEYYYKGSDLIYSLKRCTDKERAKICRYQELRNTIYGRCCRRLHRILIRKEKREPTVTVYDYVWQNIAIYGAGKKGQLFYEQITGHIKVNGNRYSSNVVLWMDQNFEEYQKRGLPVSSPELLLSVEYEQLIIAIAKKETADSIKDMLIKQGIAEYKILWINPMQ